MKTLLLILALLIALPTVQADGCAMGGTSGSVVQNGGSHDCCPGEAEETPPQEAPCVESGHCAGCVISVAVLEPRLLSIEVQHPLSEFRIPRATLVPSHSLPPYRPPIS